MEAVIRAHIREDFVADAFEIHFLDRGPGGPTRLYVPGRTNRGAGEAWAGHYEELPDGAGSELPSLYLPREALDALVREASGVLPPTAATVEHLADARVVRDRLLTIVEAQAAGQLSGPSASHVVGGRRG